MNCTCQYRKSLQLEFERSMKKRIGLVPDFTSTISADPGPDSIYLQNSLDY